MKINTIIFIAFTAFQTTFSSPKDERSFPLDDNGGQATSALDCVLSCYQDLQNKDTTYIVFPRKSDIDIYIDWKNSKRKWITFSYPKNSSLFDFFNHLKIRFKDDFQYAQINNGVLVSFKKNYFINKNPPSIPALSPFENIVIKKIKLPITRIRKVKKEIPKEELDWSNMLPSDEARKEIAQLRKNYENYPEEYYVFWSELAKLATKSDPFRRKITIRIEKKELKSYFPYVFGGKVNFKRLLEILAATMNFKCVVNDNEIVLK